MVKKPTGWQLVTSLQLAGCLYSWKLNQYGQTASRLTTRHQPSAGRLLVLLKIKSLLSNSQQVDNLSPACSWLASCREYLWESSTCNDDVTRTHLHWWHNPVISSRARDIMFDDNMFGGNLTNQQWWRHDRVWRQIIVTKMMSPSSDKFSPIYFPCMITVLNFCCRHNCNIRR